MHIEYKKVIGLPPLAWCAKVKNGKTVLMHGENVEVCRDYFVEGAWSGEFAKGDFDTSVWFCGTGGKIADNKIIFSTPTHVTYGLFFTNISDEYLISNSLYFLMAIAGYHLDAQYLNYEIDFNSILSGIYDYKQDIHVLDNNNEAVSVKVYYFRNIMIDEQNQVSVKIKSSITAFTDFNNYYSRLLDDMSSLALNAKDIKRTWRYGIVTTISKGYDAPCCAAIAKHIGCDTAVTFKAEGKYKKDCGTEIAKALGYKTIIEKDALEFMSRNDCVEAFYVASGELGAQISFSSFDKEFARNIVLTGERGDSIWGRNAENRNNNFSFDHIISELGSSERRLWVGYISVPMPLYGASAWTSLYNIANSEEMARWQLNNSYDRPIPRRIIETSGVGREMFGVDKNGAGFTYRYDWMSRIKKRMSATTAVNFDNYVKKHKKLYPIQTIVYFWKTKSVYLSRLGFKVRQHKSIEYSQIANPTVVRYLFPWAGDYLLKKYRNIFEE